MLNPNPAAIGQTASVIRTGYSWALLVNLDSAPAPTLLDENLQPVADPTPETITPEEGGTLGGEVTPGALGSAVGIDGGEGDEIQPEAPPPELPSLSLDEQILFATDTLHFYYNPEEIPVSRESNYSEGNIIGANVQPLQWVSTAGSVTRLDNLILDSDDESKTIQPWLNQIQSYMSAVPQLGRPPELAFIFGERRYAPCVLESVSWTEQAWTNGLPTRARVSLVLRKQATDEDLPVLPPEIELVPESTLSGAITAPSNQSTADGQAVVGGGGAAAPGDEAIFKEVSVYIGNGCSGYVVTANQVATAYHCIQGVGSSTSVTLEDGTKLDAEVIAGTESDDTALLQVTGHTFTTFAPLGDSDQVKVGDQVVAYGFPGGDPEEERTEGTVVALNTNRSGFPTHDFSRGLLYPGNSGGLIAAISGSQAGFVIAQTQGGTGSNAKPGANSADGLTASEMEVSDCWGVTVNTVKAEFNLG